MLRGARGFTLFEVMLSMLIMAIAVLSIAALLPSGIQAQQVARAQTIAAVTALNLVNQLEGTSPAFYRMQMESSFPWSTTNVTHEPGRFDAERILSSSVHAHNALVPVPTAIARRLDSDQDEIQDILDRGGQVYFPSPLPSRLADFEGSARNSYHVVSMAADALPYTLDGFDEAQRLVIGFVGYAQQNGLIHHPMTASPYREWYPSPPIDMVFGPRVRDIDRNPSASAGAPLTDLIPDPGYTRTFDQIGNIDLAAWAYWDAKYDPADFPHYAAFLSMYDTYTDPDDSTGQLAADPRADDRKPPYAGLHHELAARLEWETASADDIDQLCQKIEAHYQACLDLAEACYGSSLTGIDPTTWDVRAMVPGDPRRTLEPWTVRAMRYLGSAAMMRTRPEFATWAGANGVTFDETQMADLHELSLRAAAIYAAHRPHDWGAERMYNGATLMDSPLVQLDLFGGLLNDPAGSVTGGAGYGPGYRLVAPQGCTAESTTVGGTTVDGIGSRSAVTDGNTAATLAGPVRPLDVPTNYYGNWSASTDNATTIADRIDGYWGDPERFNLLHAFEASERCRQMVVWSVDWQRYEDVESAEAVVADASWYPWDSRDSWDGGSLARNRHELTYRRRGYHTLGYFGPYSAHLNWRVDPGTTTISVQTYGSSGIKHYMRGVDSIKTERGGNPSLSESMLPWIGSFGLDVNGNGLHDRGTVPTSGRMRASTVARFNLYDQRVFAGLRD